MARLRNRIRKADYFSDGELLRWHRDKRATYSGLYAIAEDSGCLEDDCFNWKLLLWPSPMDADLTVELLEQWRDEMVAAGKLVPYEVDGQRFLFLRSFHKHEHPRNPQNPAVPLPPWVTWVPPGDGTKAHYVVRTDAIPSPNSTCTESVQSVYSTCTASPAPPRPAPSRPVLSLQALVDADAPTGALVSDSDTDFDEWWCEYGKVGSKADALKLYQHWRAHGASREDLLAAAVAYREHCTATDCKLAHARTFLAKKPNRWREWADGEAHGSMDAAGTSRLSDVLAAGAEAFGLTGGNNGNGTRTLERGGPARAPGSRKDARRGLPATELED